MPIQVPIGAEDKFKGVVDLFTMKKIVYTDDLGSTMAQEDVDGELRDLAMKWRQHLVEAIAEQDDELLEMFFEGKELPIDRMKTALRKATIEGTVLPMLCGSAFKNKGIQPLLDAVVDYMPSPLEAKPIVGRDPKTGDEIARKPDDSEPFCALAFKIATDPYGNLTYFRVYSGVLEQGQLRAQLAHRTQGTHRAHPAHARQPSRGHRLDRRGRHRRGGRSLRHAHRRHALRREARRSRSSRSRSPSRSSHQAIEPKSKADQDKLGLALTRLAQEDPTFRMRTDEETQQTIIAGMGELHLEIILDRLRREFKVEANVGKPQVAYKEAITKTVEKEGRFVRQTGGKGQYGDVWLRVEPQPPGTGFVFEWKIVGGAVPKEYAKAVQEGIRESAQSGVLAGFPVLDFKVDGLRRFVPRGRLVGDGLQDRGLDGVEGSQPRGRPDSARADHEGRGDDAQGVHGRDQRRSRTGAAARSTRPKRRRAARR